jgi:hypothetical protein
MRILETEFDHKGWHFRQIAREGMVAIYHRQKRIGGNVEHWEVIRIHIERPTEINGVHYPERENYPRSEEWGQDGFTCHTLERAREKFDSMVQKTGLIGV